MPLGQLARADAPVPLMYVQVAEPWLLSMLLAEGVSSGQAASGLVVAHSRKLDWDNNPVVVCGMAEHDEASVYGGSVPVAPRLT